MKEGKDLVPSRKRSAQFAEEETHSSSRKNARFDDGGDTDEQMNVEEDTTTTTPNDIEMADVDEVIIGDWKVRGLSAALRMMCAYNGIRYRNIVYATNSKLEQSRPGYVSEWYAKAKGVLEKKNPFINLPYIQHRGNLISQTNACMRYLTRLTQDNDETDVELIQLLEQVMEMRLAWRRFLYSKKEDVKKQTDEHMKLIEKHYIKLENWLKLKGTICLLGENPSAPDFHLW
eukprot:CAMPEP_0197528870 /NCGR_PEP_ID=MMETSP1318-20131121/26592_1 /TAXON_ID=552666 /ORGANISM="Partenskyella glossopodia, Strain RCC365" /LENGTH=230 /DNA_ID=CAMNT_0043084141 /DNA_START=248 /DNA_END=937 /DNA_ORIENTATION=+